MVSVGIWVVGRLSRDDRAGMERLYRAYYEGADEGNFARDLAEKDWAIVLRDAEGEGLLRANYHYAHAVNLGQLDPVEVVEVKDGLGRWCAAANVPRASAKPPSLGNFG